MKSSVFLSLALGAGWILSPEALVIAGNVSGQIGWMTFPSLLGVVLLYSVCSRLLCNATLPSAPGREFLILQKGSGTLIAVTLSLAACLPLTILAGTALLVTAGYTFNEVFLYWFPNFGFSFLLLALLTILQLFSRKYALYLQLGFTGLAMGGLLLLALYGLLSTGSASAELVQQPVDFSLASATLLLLLFVGHNSSPEQKSTPLSLPLIMGFLVFLLWIHASLYHVTQDKLAFSTIPYMTTAREILGEPGRLLMGMVIISGTCGALNGLMILSRNMVRSLTVANTVSSCLPPRRRRWLLPLFLAAAIGICMATGLAGNDLLESLLRSALTLWLLYYSILCLAAVYLVQKKSASIPYPALFCTLGLIAGCIILIAGDPRRLQMSIFILSVLSAGGLLAACWNFITRHHSHPPQP